MLYIDCFKHMTCFIIDATKYFHIKHLIAFQINLNPGPAFTINILQRVCRITRVIVVMYLAKLHKNLLNRSSKTLEALNRRNKSNPFKISKHT
ncbi:hypothetical protein ACJIZ3_024883 [Penstemon smallii]|uniref:Uncharacterized protein n=1 Tax=Penstemon smallii TaxID=265156 RepID=A0ABD3TVQ8_9LAMI